MDAAEPTTCNLNRGAQLAEIVRSYPFRLALYGCVAVAVFQVVYVGVMELGTGVMGGENGPIEIAQAMLAVAASVCLFYAASRVTAGKAGLVACAALAGYAAARESDMLFETLFFDDAYKWLVGLPLFIIAAMVVFRQRRRLIADTMGLMRQPAATLFIVAGIYLIGVCQVLDRPDLWANISSPKEAAATKALIEEFSELFAYLLLAFSGIEAVLLARRPAIAAVTDCSEPTIRLAA